MAALSGHDLAKVGPRKQGRSQEDVHGECVVLVATKDRPQDILVHALPSIQRQTQAPVAVIVVNDGTPMGTDLIQAIRRAVDPVPAIIVNNVRSPGVAGAWNCGLELLAERSFEGFVAILDDDDEWDANHLLVNGRTAQRTGANIVVSGLRCTFDGHRMERPMIDSLSPGEFLVGNPGWQGSNTFVAFRMLREVGGFRDGLLSHNDRDLAIRLLRARGAMAAFTGAWTATWRSRSTGTLSARRSPAKLSGMRWFWHLYGPDMSAGQSEAFFERGWRLFGIEQDEIIQHCGDVPPHRRARGDFHAAK